MNLDDVDGSDGDGGALAQKVRRNSQEHLDECFDEESAVATRKGFAAIPQIRAADLTILVSGLNFFPAPRTLSKHAQAVRVPGDAQNVRAPALRRGRLRGGAGPSLVRRALGIPVDDTTGKGLAGLASSSFRLGRNLIPPRAGLVPFWCLTGR